MIEEKKMNMIVIGAALPRTGTLSMKFALEKLGFNCYHMVEIVRNDHSKIWADLYSGKRSDLQTPLKNFQATVDTPGCFFWEELLKLNPDAKVILTLRDTPEAWVESMNETVLQTLDPSRRTFGMYLCKWLIGRISRSFEVLDAIYKKLPEGCKKEDMVEFYKNYQNSVKSKCPSDKLLVFNVKQGWEPLCKFLGVPVPNEEFPRVNDAKYFKRNLFLIKSMGYFLLLINIGIITGGAFLIKKYWRQAFNKFLK